MASVLPHALLLPSNFVFACPVIQTSVRHRLISEALVTAVRAGWCGIGAIGRFFQVACEPWSRSSRSCFLEKRVLGHAPAGVHLRTDSMPQAHAHAHVHSACFQSDVLCFRFHWHASWHAPGLCASLPENRRFQALLSTENFQAEHATCSLFFLEKQRDGCV